ncbi:cyclin-G2-like [Corythoichthys intestinalis]|uniref:cyclin-G2-like n=1 Tax=Corythoichthys intestinalis TaxID=161448 RepID=UPI0025A6638F|nr:cyclin-G2-like [Corythoichthys intestinalis]
MFFSRMRDHGGLDKALVKELKSCCAREGYFLPSKSGLKMIEISENGVSAKCRDAQVEELWGLTSFHGYSMQTFVRAVNLFDRFLTLVKAEPKHVPLVSVCCLGLAARVTEEAADVAPSHQPLGRFSTSELLRTEEALALQLGSDTPAPTAFTFLHLYYSALDSACHDEGTEIPNVAKLEAQLKACLCRLVFAKAKPSVLALALVANDMGNLQSPAATEVVRQLQRLAKVGNSDLRHWRNLVAKRMTEYRSTRCHKPDGRKLVWPLSKRTVRSLRAAHCATPGLPTIPEDAWDQSEEDTSGAEDSPCGSLGSVGEGTFFPLSYL